MFHVFAERVHDKTGASIGRPAVQMSADPMPHDEACVFLSKMPNHRPAHHIRYFLRPVDVSA